MIQEEGVLKNQELENAVLDADFTKAIQVAFELRRPHKLYECFSQVWRLGMIFFYFLFMFSSFPCTGSLLNF